MRTHNGMRPQDIYILLGIIAQKNKKWLMTELAQKLYISASEVSESLNRSSMAGLIDSSKKEINRNALMEFLVHGLRFVFPGKPGPTVRGIPTAYSAGALQKILTGNDIVVWPYAKGTAKGQGITPLYNSAVEASLTNPELYELLALADTLRIGRAREKEMAESELKKRITNGEQDY